MTAARIVEVIRVAIEEAGRCPDFEGPEPCDGLEGCDACLLIVSTAIADVVEGFQTAVNLHHAQLEQLREMMT